MTWLTSFLSYLNYLFTFTQTGHWRRHAQGRLVSARSDLLSLGLFLDLTTPFPIKTRTCLSTCSLSLSFFTHHTQKLQRFCCLSVMSYLNIWTQVHFTMLNENHFLQLLNLNSPMSRLLISASPSLLTFHWLQDNAWPTLLPALY